MIQLVWRAPADEYGQLIKVSCDRGSPLGLHTHDYPEVFWIAEGRCRHRINEREEILETGDLVFIRARDRHQFISISRERFTMTNLECQSDLIRSMKRRHAASFGAWFDERPRLPLHHKLSASSLRRLELLSTDFAARRPDLLQVEGFLLDLARLLDAPPALSGIGDCPDWLQSALIHVQSPNGFIHGPSGLYQAAGRCPEHVARLCRQYLDQTPTELIERFRMVHAEREIRITRRSITEIALACGYSTTAQFHRAFKRHFQRTPLRYRRWIRGG